ncbi:MAG: hypothetical protein ACR2KW_03700, partial [Rubrobacter sp.]
RVGYTTTPQQFHNCPETHHVRRPALLYPRRYPFVTGKADKTKIFKITLAETKINGYNKSRSKNKRIWEK